MALLTYDIRVVGQRELDNALRSVERRYAQSGQRIARSLGLSLGGTRGGGGRATSARSERAEANAVAREQQRHAREQAKLVAQHERAQAKAHAQRMRQIEKEKRAEVAAAQAVRREQDRRKQEFRRTVRGHVGNAGRTVSAVGRGALTTVGIGGGIVFGTAVNREIKERAQASELANQVGRPGIKRQLLTEARQHKGFTGEEVLAGTNAFVERTGNLDAAREAMLELTQLSLATGANLEDLGASAGAAFVPIADAIKDPVEQMRQLREVMRGMAAQGGEGAIEMRNFARELGSMAAAGRKFEGGPGDTIRSMGALAQLSVQRGGAASAAEATTAVVRFASDITKHADRFDKAGIGVFADKGKTQLRSPEEILADVAAKTGGDLTKLQALGFGAESANAVAGLMPVFNEAEAKQKGSGRAAMLAEFNRFMKASLTDQQIKERASSRLSDEDMQLKEAFKELNIVVGKELVPALIRFVPEFAKMIPLIGRATHELGRFVGWLAENPLKGIGLVIAGAVAKDIAAAKIGDVIARIISGAAPGGGGAGPLGAGGPGGAKLLGAGVLATAGVALATDQADKLKTSTGAKHSLTELLPGMTGKGFSSDQLLEDLFNPFAAAERRAGVIGDVVSSTLNFDKRADEEARRQFAARPATAAQTVPQMTMPNAGQYPSGKHPLSKATADPPIADDPSIAGHLRAAKALSEAADKLSRAPLNRTDHPSPPVVK